MADLELFDSHHQSLGKVTSDALSGYINLDFPDLAEGTYNLKVVKQDPHLSLGDEGGHFDIVTNGQHQPAAIQLSGSPVDHH